MQAGSEVTDYIYDGMGRLLGVLKHASEHGNSVDATTVSTSYAYLDSGHQLVVTQDNGRVHTETRNAAGRVIAVTESGVVSGATVTRTTLNYYDSAGQLRATQDANGGRSKTRLEAPGNRMRRALFASCLILMLVSQARAQTAAVPPRR